MLIKLKVMKDKTSAVFTIKTSLSRLKFVLLSFVFLLISFESQAQCAMCRAVLTNKDNVTKAEAVNDGIVYLMVIPYILIAGIGYYIYKMKQKK